MHDETARSSADGRTSGQRSTGAGGIGAQAARAPTGAMSAGAKAHAAGIPAAPQETPPPTLLVGEREHRLYVLTPENIEYIEAQGNYVKLNASGADYISRNSVKRLAISLADRGFLRIERSLIVNVRAIAYAQRAGQGTYIFTLHSGISLRSGARYRGRILQVIPLLQPTR
ncbi:MAG TPA: LytTR family DNA-binding domain-containing protein [Steroidobacteraceae bacterium]|jgi:DNA-binding LytR/AlgR family response regulator|nr:LytTR family DNA-binding domain-containing protein [Steroidobacteraceae bacterium]